MQYIIEHFELTPGQTPAFAEGFRKSYLPLMSGEGARLVGLWETVAVSLYWPRAMALWEVDGPEEYQALVRRLYGDRLKALRDWQASLAGICTGGEGRLLAKAEAAPTLQDLSDRAVDLRVIVYERITAQTDQQMAYVTEIQRTWIPVAETLGRIWIGTYHTIWKNREAYSLWALEDPDNPLPRHGADERNVSQLEPVKEWMRLAPELRESYDDGIMIALPPTRGASPQP